MNSVGIWRGPSFHGQSSLCCVKVNQPIHFTLLLEHKKYFSSLCEISLFPTRIRKKNWAIFRAYSILNLIKGYVRILAGNKENDKTGELFLSFHVFTYDIKSRILNCRNNRHSISIFIIKNHFEIWVIRWPNVTC